MFSYIIITERIHTQCVCVCVCVDAQENDGVVLFKERSDHNDLCEWIFYIWMVSIKSVSFIDHIAFVTFLSYLTDSTLQVTILWKSVIVVEEIILIGCLSSFFWDFNGRLANFEIYFLHRVSIFVLIKTNQLSNK